mgnify:CR=1 FL=1
MTGLQAQASLAQGLSAVTGDMRIDDVVSWLGHRDDARKIMRMLDVFALPSLEENLPLSILEAMACGVPVVATSVGGIPECVVDRQTGFLVPPAKSQPLANALQHLLLQPKLARTMGQAGQQRIHEQFSIDSQLSKLENIFQRMAA